MAIQREPVVCFFEDRRESEDPLRLAIASLQQHCPGAQTRVFLAHASPEFLDWAARFPSVTVGAPRWSTATGWDSKPSALLSLLDEGWSEVLWLDADVIVNRDLLAELSRWPAATLIAAEEVWFAPRQGTRWRAEAWGLEPGREFGCTVNSCVLRVAPPHRALLEAWRAHLARDDYRAAQRRPGSERPLHLVNDQDALSALLGAQPWSGLAVHLLRSGADIVHNGDARSYSLGERWARLRSGRTLLVHSICLKPWLVPAAGRLDLGFFLFSELDMEASVYVSHARRLRAVASLERRWLERRVAPVWILCIGAFGGDVWRGLPYQIFRTVVRRCGFNWPAGRLGARVRA